ncbi:MAG: hypothetical protein IOC82_11350 [Aestuariivirga sp.]|nr:hypothetical protein [Aestuariivirga sp.]
MPRLRCLDGHGAAGHELKVGRFPFLANGKAIALDEDQDLITTIFDARTGRLLGTHPRGSNALVSLAGSSSVRERKGGYCLLHDVKQPGE